MRLECHLECQHDAACFPASGGSSSMSVCCELRRVPEGEERRGEERVVQRALDPLPIARWLVVKAEEFKNVPCVGRY